MRSIWSVWHGFDGKIAGMLTTTNLQRFIDESAISAELVHLPTTVLTVEMAAQAVGCRHEQICKTILFMVKNGEPLLVIANGLARINYKKLADYLGVGRKRLRLATAEQVVDLLGYPVGTVPPFGHLTRVRTVLEAGVPALDELYAGGGGVQSLIKITVPELQRVVGDTVVSLAKFEAKNAGSKANSEKA